MRIVLMGLALVLLALLAFSYAGALHPAGDSFAVFRVPLICALGLLALIFWRARLGQAGLVLCGLLLAARVVQAVPAAEIEAPDVILYQKNLLFLDYDYGPLLNDIWASEARIITLQELSRAHLDLLEVLKDTHPYQVICGGTAVGAVAVLSTDPIVAQACSDPAGIAMAEIAAFGGEVRLRAVSVHLHWPWPHSQARGLDRTLPQFEGLAPLPTVLGGDFNMVPWGHALRRVEDVFGLARMGHVERTFRVLGYPIAIDHIMAGPEAEGHVEVRDQLGSDHYGLVGRIVLTAP